VRSVRSGAARPLRQPAPGQPLPIDYPALDMRATRANQGQRPRSRNWPCTGHDRRLPQSVSLGLVRAPLRALKPGPVLDLGRQSSFRTRAERYALYMRLHSTCHCAKYKRAAVVQIQALSCGNDAARRGLRPCVPAPPTMRPHRPSTPMRRHLCTRREGTLVCLRAKDNPLVHVYASRETRKPPVREQPRRVTLFTHHQGRLVPRAVSIFDSFLALPSRLSRVGSSLRFSKH
jgi:hypothetical protein